MRPVRVAALAAASTILLTAAAQAADILDEPEVVEVVEPFSWTGPFGGLFGGVAGANFDYDASYTGAVNASRSFSDEEIGVFAGVQLGFDYAFNRFVVGAVADIALSDIEGKGERIVPGIGRTQARSELTYIGTIRGRLGYAVLERLLVYGHGGFVYAGVDRDVSVAGVGGLGGADDTKTGWTIGAGLEYAITDNISIQTEYGYYDLGSDRIYRGSVLGGDRLNVEEDLDFHAVRAAINYRF